MRKKTINSERKTKTAEQALLSLQALCARAERSSGDALRLMARWGVPQEQQRGILQQLENDRFIDDNRYAACYIREKTRLSGWGRYKIVAQLRGKGIASEIIEEQMSQIEGGAMSKRLEQELHKYARKVKYSSSRELRDKLFRRGATLGYDSSMVRAAVDNTLSDFTHNQDDEEVCLDF